MALLVVPNVPSDLTILTELSSGRDSAPIFSISTKIPPIVDPVGIENPKLVAFK